MCVCTCVCVCVCVRACAQFSSKATLSSDSNSKLEVYICMVGASCPGAIRVWNLEVLLSPLDMS